MLIHAGNLDTSDRLQRALRVLKEAGPDGLTGLEWSRKANIQNPGTTASELRANHRYIVCEYSHRTRAGAKIYRYFCSVDCYP